MLRSSLVGANSPMNEKQRRTENETLVLFRLFVVVVQYHAIKAEIDLELPPFGFGGPK